MKSWTMTKTVSLFRKDHRDDNKEREQFITKLWLVYEQ